jgi:DNA-binding transcriptional ArsR family regulator
VKRGELKEGRRPPTERTRQPGVAPTWAVANYIRLAALTLLHEKELSPGDIAEILDEDVKNVTDHLRQLYDAGCVEFAGHQGDQNLRRAVYRAIARPFVSDEEYQAMSIEERTDLNGVALQWIFAECLASYRSGRMNEDDDLCLVSDEPNLDLKGRKELRELLLSTWIGSPDSQEVLNGVQEIAGRAANRMAKSKETGTTTVVALMAFDRGRPSST